jgi:putative transposase
MHYNYKYRLDPPKALTETLLYHVDTCRQLYNHVLYKLNEADEVPARYKVQGTLPDLKSWWDNLTDVHSKVLQMVVKRVYDNLSTLKAQKQNGRAVGMLKWKPPREYRPLTYNQSGFKLKNTSGRTTLWLSKIGEIPIHLHRDIPEDATIKQVTVKQEPTGEWYATFGIDVDEATPEKVVGIDLGILKYAHDTDGYAIESPDFSNERERLERAQRDLSRKQHGSANWEKQRRVVAERYAELKNKRHDFLHKLSNYYRDSRSRSAEFSLRPGAGNRFPRRNLWISTRIPIRPQIRPRGRRRLGREGLGRTTGQLPQPCGSGVGNLPSDARIQVRTRRNALRRRESSRNNKRVCVLWRFN